ncbi:BrnT family toxin [Sphingomonas sp. Tas61C01]|uniref:BrnT family toxin n=1 Tax=Sphingomonas sp. Tas61C01 TaxID=3458297 RepID=UPI00403EB8BF
MEVSFDPEKRAATLLERSLDFADAVTVFDGPVFEFEDDRFDYAEPRYSTVGMLDGRMVVVIWTEAEGGRRVISMRNANEREQTKFRHRLA